MNSSCGLVDFAVCIDLVAGPAAGRRGEVKRAVGVRQQRVPGVGEARGRGRRVY